MRAWFASLQARERWIFVGGGVLAAVIVVWAIVLVPLANGSAELRDAVAAKQRLLNNVRRAETLEPAAGPQTPRSSEQSLVVLVSETGQSRGLAFTRTRPEGQDGINVSFQAASFDALLDWLITMETTHGVSVESAQFNSSGQRGLVSGQVLLRRS